LRILCVRDPVEEERRGTGLDGLPLIDDLLYEDPMSVYSRFNEFLEEAWEPELEPYCDSTTIGCGINGNCIAGGFTLFWF
jgi:hypothetical protein